MTPTSTEPTSKLPEVWAHRGASLEFPENSLASFEGAIREGTEGLETDVHTTSDGRILMFHDPTLDRTTDGTGAIKDLPWMGNIEHVRTVKAPHQPIPLFEQLLELLMRPEARHVRINIDVKANNDPERTFGIMGKLLRQIPNWEEDLAPRLILGLWHPAFIQPARELIPGATIHHITVSLSMSQNIFWDHVSGFSVAFPLLLTPAGDQFRERCKREGKEFGVWTVNDKAEMCVAASWGANWVLTDIPGVWKELRKELKENFEATYHSHVSYWFSWSALRYYVSCVIGWLLGIQLISAYWDRLVRSKLEGIGGPLDIEIPDLDAGATPRVSVEPLPPLPKSSGIAV